MITIEPGVLAVLLGWIGTIIASLAYVLKTRADTQRVSEQSKGEVAKTEAMSDGRLTEAILSLAQSLNANSQQAGIERQQTLMAIEKSGGRVEGMMVAIVDNTKTVRETGAAIKDLINTIDEFGPRLQHIPQIKSDVLEIKTYTSTLETNIGESIEGSIGAQLVPVAEALIGIDKELKALAKESQERDARNHSNFLELIALFQEAKTQFLKALEQYAIAHMKDLLPPDTSLTEVKEATKETQSS